MGKINSLARVNKGSHVHVQYRCEVFEDSAKV